MGEIIKVIQPIKMFCISELLFDSSKTYLSKDKNSLFELNDERKGRVGGEGRWQKRSDTRTHIYSYNNVALPYFTFEYTLYYNSVGSL